MHHCGLDICRGGPREHTSAFLFSPKFFLRNNGPLSSGTQLSHLRRRGRRVRGLPPPQASRCPQPPEHPQHWNQGSHHVDYHPLGPQPPEKPQHWGQGSHHVDDHPLAQGPAACASQCLPESVEGLAAASCQTCVHRRQTAAAQADHYPLTQGPAACVPESVDGLGRSKPAAPFVHRRQTAAMLHRRQMATPLRSWAPQPDLPTYPNKGLGYLST